MGEKSYDVRSLCAPWDFPPAVMTVEGGTCPGVRQIRLIKKDKVYIPIPMLLFYILVKNFNTEAGALFSASE